MGDVNEEGRVVVELSDLVEELRGRRNRRFRRAFADQFNRGDPSVTFPDDDQYTEWRLRLNAREMLQMLDESPDAADVLLTGLLLHDPGNFKVVWFSNGHAIVCEGPQTRFMFSGNTTTHPMIVRSNHQHQHHQQQQEEESSSSHSFSLSSIDGVDPEDLDPVVHLLHKVIALGTCVTFVEEMVHTHVPGIIPDIQDWLTPGLQDFVSLSRSRRTLFLISGATRINARALAYHCNPTVELVVYVQDWIDNGEDLAEAMQANQCPTRLTLAGEFFDFDAVARARFAPALASVTCIEELTILVPMGNADMWQAVAGNAGLRTLSVRPTGPVHSFRDLRLFWRAALANRTLHSIHATGRGLQEDLDGMESNLESDRREVAELVATLIRSNPRITSLRYDPIVHDPDIMETRVMPIVYLNRFRPIVQDALLGRGGMPNAPASTTTTTIQDPKERAVSMLIGSPLVRRHPELLYCLLQAGRDYLLRVVPPPPPPSLATDTPGLRRRASVRLARKRRWPGT